MVRVLVSVNLPTGARKIGVVVSGVTALMPLHMSNAVLNPTVIMSGAVSAYIPERTA